MENKKSGLNGNSLKLLMALMMPLDHIGAFIPQNAALALHVLTRCVAPVFAFMAVEGFIHTSHRGRYCLRLFAFAGLVFAGDVAISLAFASKGVTCWNNIILTFAMGVLMLCALENKTLPAYIRLLLGLLTLAAGVMYTEGGLALLPFMLVTYYIKDGAKRELAYVLLSALLFVAVYLMFKPQSGKLVRTMLEYGDWLVIACIPFIRLYNGERGAKNAFTKYFFYIFYPAHIWLLKAAEFYLL